MDDDLLLKSGSLMTQNQLKFLRDLKLVLEKRIRNQDIVFLADNEEKIFEILENTFAQKSNLETLIDRLKRKPVRYRVLTTYPEWKRTCENCIVMLREIGCPSMHTRRFYSNVIRFIGYFISLVGSAVTLTSVVDKNLFFFKNSAFVGVFMTATGCGTAFITSFTEMVLLNDKVKKAQEVIEEYIKQYPENNNSDHAAETEPSSEILRINIMKGIVESAKDLVDRVMKIKNDRQRVEFIGSAVDAIIDVQSSYGTQVISNTAIENILSAQVTIFLVLFNTENRLVFDLASLAIRGIFTIALLIDSRFNIALVMNLFRADASAAKGISKVVTRGAVTTLGIVVDVAGLTLIAIDIYKGSRCPESEYINKVIENLEEEANIVQTIYDRIIKSP